MIKQHHTDNSQTYHKYELLYSISPHNNKQPIAVTHWLFIFKHDVVSESP